MEDYGYAKLQDLARKPKWKKTRERGREKEKLRNISGLWSEKLA